MKDLRAPCSRPSSQYLIPFLLVLSVVVFVHEFGHYWVARRNGVRIEVFSIGFGPELFGRNDRHGTRWKFSADPARRLRQDAGRRRRGERHRRRRPRARPGQLPEQDRLAADGDRGRRPDRQLPLRDRGAGDPVRRRRPAVHAGRGRRGPAGQPGRRGGPRCPATGSPRSTASRSRASRSCRRSCSRQRRPAARCCRSTATARPLELTVTPAMQRDRRTASATQHQVWR